MKSKSKTINNKISKNKENRVGDNEIGVPKSQVVKFAIGMILLFVSIFLLLAFTSFIRSGKADCSILECQDGTLVTDAIYQNSCGALGAVVAYQLINMSFGFASYLIPILLILFGLKLVGSFKLNVMKLFVIIGIGILWISIFLSTPFVLHPWFDESFIHPGGAHGKSIANGLVSLLGEPGLYCILLLSAIFVLIYFSLKTIDIIRSLLRLNHIRSFGGKALGWTERVTAAFLGMFKKKEKEIIAEDEDDALNNCIVDPETGEIISDSSNGDVDEENEDNSVKLTLYEQLQNSKSDNEKKKECVENTNSASFEIVGHEDEQIKDDKSDILNAKEVENDVSDVVETNQKDDLAAAFDKVAGAKPVEDTKPEVEFTIEENVENANEGVDENEEIEAEDLSTPYDPHKDLEQYNYPTLDLLDQPEDKTTQIDMDEQNANKERIITVLHSFGVEISSIKATIGPTITLYEITPAEGMRISKIRNLEDDIALSLAAEGIRIIAPIPGKGTIGIEVPNKQKCMVSMASILSSKKYQESNMELPCALGKTITNEVFMVDLAKAPHMLVAGATGMGKSVGLNAIVTSLLYKKHPSELKIVMVDPKKVEFSIYSPIENHFLAKLEEENEPIITDVQHVVKTLNSLCQLMDHRYDLLKQAHVRNIKEYNEKFKARQLNPNNGHEFMPYYVVIIDEFGDLIMTAGKEIELPICRIAQLARAVGIHMIIATQRPTTNIITGTIKANFPARIAFRVAAMMDSRTILDRPGANQLIGKGDMLYLQGGDPVRVQCAFVDTPEVARICNFISTQQSYPHAAYLPEVASDGDEDGGGSSEDIGKLDPMFAECAKLIVSKQQGSTSLLQRQFAIGYNRAGRLMDQMEKAGIVGPQIGSKPREVLVQDFNTLDNIINSLS